MKNISAVLAIQDYKLHVNLGVTAKERTKKQVILLNLKIFFPKLPLACKSDKLQDTICYQKLTEDINKFCAKRKFQLLEYLTAELLVFIAAKLPNRCKIELTLVKKPNILGLKNCFFTLANANIHNF